VCLQSHRQAGSITEPSVNVIAGLYLWGEGVWGFNPLHEVANPPVIPPKVFRGLTETPLIPLLPMLEISSKGMHCVCVNIECRLAS